ncbi:MAG: rane protein [Gaiellales bacterium]|nr:rane protein [Gaiellales bacterium]
MASTSEASRQAAGSPSPQPERREPRISDPGLRDLSLADYFAIVVRALKKAQKNQVSHLAQAIAFNGFMAIPSALLLALGVFSAVAGPDSVNTLLDHLGSVVPASALDLVRSSLKQVLAARQGGIMIAVGAALALWSLSGAMQTVMWSLNTAYEREETRGFVRARLVSIVMGICVLLAVVLVVFGLVLGPLISSWIGDQVGASGAVTWLWDIGRFPLIVLGLMASFASVLYLGPDVEQRRFRLITPGAIVALVLWLVVSAGFAVYANNFSSYNKAWGSLAAVIVTLTWLWLSSLALLLGAEINAETERSRALREGERSNAGLDPPTKT